VNRVTKRIYIQKNKIQKNMVQTQFGDIVVIVNRFDNASTA